MYAIIQMHCTVLWYLVGGVVRDIGHRHRPSVGPGTSAHSTIVHTIVQDVTGDYYSWTLLLYDSTSIITVLAQPMGAVQPGRTASLGLGMYVRACVRAVTGVVTLIVTDRNIIPPCTSNNNIYLSYPPLC